MGIKQDINTSLKHIVICSESGAFIKNVYIKKCTMCFGGGYIYKASLKKIDCPQCGGNGEIVIK